MDFEHGTVAVAGEGNELSLLFVENRQRSLLGSMSEPAATIPQRSGISVTTGRAAKGCVTMSHLQGTGCRLSLLRKSSLFQNQLLAEMLLPIFWS